MPSYVTPDWVSHHTAAWRRWLNHLVGRDDSHIVEIGCLEGRSAIWLLDNVLTGQGCTLTTIDPWLNERFHEWNVREIEANARANLEPYIEAGRCQILRGLSSDILPTMPTAMYDGVYIDGDHSALGCLTDLVLAWPLLRPGGVVWLDDYLWGDHDWCTPRTAIEAFRRCLPPATRYEISRTGLGQVAIWKP